MPNELPDDFTPAEVFCLAEFLCDEMRARGWRTEDVALRMGADTPQKLAEDLLCIDLLMCVHEDKLLVGDRMFAALAKAFDIDEQCLQNLDEMWRKYPDRRSPFKAPGSIFGPTSRRAAFRTVN